MSENPLQLLLKALGKVSVCIQTHLSHIVLRPGDSSSSSLSKNQSSLLSLSTAASHLQPSGIIIKNIRSAFLFWSDNYGRPTMTHGAATEQIKNPCLYLGKSYQGKSSGPTTKEDLGRATWTFLHTLAAQYPDNPTRQQKKDVKELMAILSRLYPCKECADHFKEVIRANPPHAGSHHEFSQWLCHVHNVVNRSLGKVVFPCERVDARWGKLECEQRACDLQGTSMDLSDRFK